MISINRDIVCDALHELSDIGTQRRLWLSDGEDGQEVSSIVEAVERLFSDSGLGHLFMSPSGSGLGHVADELLKSLHYAIKKIDCCDFPQATIANPAMIDVRKISSMLLNTICVGYRTAQGTKELKTPELNMETRTPNHG